MAAKKQQKAKPVSLAPLTFGEAVGGLLAVQPTQKKSMGKKRKRKSPSKKK